MEKFHFKEIRQTFGVVPKDPHTITDKYPLRLSKRPGEKGAEEEFRAMNAYGKTGMERYVEWKKAG